MKRTLFALTMLALVLPAAQRTQADVEVNFDFFYNNVSGGSWIEVGDYGYCWQPEVAVSNTSWRPYTDGYWAYTDLGWTWVSYEDFGWATYHYGRWVRLADQGWVWAPGRDSELEWGPAWVSWRTGGDYIGWAPLPPEVTVTEGGVIGGRIDVDFDIGPAYYNFVELRYIGEPVLRERIFEPSRNVTYIQQTVNVTNITYKNKVVYNYGPDVNVVNKYSARPIQRLRLERQENVDPSVAVKSGAFKVQGDKLVVASPMRIKKPAQLPPPPNIKTKVAQAKVDKGWSVVGDEKAQSELKQKIKTQDLKKVPPPTGAGAAAQATVGTSPVAGASPMASASPATAITPFERGKGTNRNRPGEQGAAGAPAAGTSPTGAASPGETTTMPERGKHKGRHGEQLPTTPPAPTGATSPAGAGSPSETTTMPERGRHKGGRMETSPTESANSPAGAPTVAPEGMPQTGGGKKGNRRLEQGAGPTESGDVPGETERGKHKGRALEQATPPAGGASQDLQGQGARGRGEGAQRQPGAPTKGSAEGQPGQGKQEGGKKQKGQPAPSASPSPQ
jgi:hypothetical protein